MIPSVIDRINQFFEYKFLSGEQSAQLKQLDLNKTSKPLWVEVSRKDFSSLIKDVADNLDNKRQN